MASGNVLSRLLSPIRSGLRHVFFRPITLKYPFQGPTSIPDSNYRFNPKERVAYPGYKGRHILHLDRCTGCGTCDLTCQNIAEAITMVHGFDISLRFGEEFRREMEDGGEAAEAAALLIKHFTAEYKRLEEVEGGYLLRLNDEPIFDYRAEAVYENLLEDAVDELRRKGWRIEEVEKKAGERLEYLMVKDALEAKLIIEKREFGLKQNKRSIFPAIDYGRCVFCGFCVDACPFTAMEMGTSYELSSLEREELFYTPLMLSSKPFDTYPPETTWAEKLVMVARRYR